MILPFDVIQASILLGSIPGAVMGGATVIAGRVGEALHLNGINQNVNFGPYTPACFRTIHMCPDGVTWAMWLKLEGDSHSVILDTGAYYSSSLGYSIVRRTGGVFRVLYSNLTHAHALDLTHWRLGQWVHLAFVLYPASWADMYLNGCRVNDAVLSYSMHPRSVSLTQYMPFVIGSSAWDQRYTVMAIDNLIVWYDVLTPNDIWKLYLQGGDMWWWRPFFNMTGI